VNAPASLPPPARLASEVRTPAIRRVLWLILLANWAVALAKVVLGVVASSAAMTADGLHSFLDGASNVIGLVAMHYAGQPADPEHPYGHQKFEALAALAIGVMIGVGVLQLGQMAVDAIVRNIHPTVGLQSLGVMVVTVVVNLLVTRYERREGQRLGSSLLLADAQHTLSDVFVSLTVIVSLGLSWAGVGRADGVVALVVLGFVSWTGWSIIKQAAGILADMVRIDPAAVRAVCEGIPDVIRVRDVRSRGMEGSVYVDLKLDVDPQLTIERAHAASDAVELAISRAFPEVVDVVVHVEPGHPA
jgi:cation diffusion facilitator family transporter